VWYVDAVRRNVEAGTGKETDIAIQEKVSSCREVLRGRIGSVDDVLREESLDDQRWGKGGN